MHLSRQLASDAKYVREPILDLPPVTAKPLRVSTVKLEQELRRIMRNPNWFCFQPVSFEVVCYPATVKWYTAWEGGKTSEEWRINESKGKRSLTGEIRDEQSHRSKKGKDKVRDEMHLLGWKMCLLSYWLLLTQLWENRLPWVVLRHLTTYKAKGCFLLHLPFEVVDKT